MGVKYRIRFANTPLCTWEGETLTDDFGEALETFKAACRDYDTVDFQVRLSGSKPAGEGGDGDGRD